jgi:hypothetical protein
MQNCTPSLLKCIWRVAVAASGPAGGGGPTGGGVQGDRRPLGQLRRPPPQLRLRHGLHAAVAFASLEIRHGLHAAMASAPLEIRERGAKERGGDLRRPAGEGGRSSTVTPSCRFCRAAVSSNARRSSPPEEEGRGMHYLFACCSWRHHFEMEKQSTVLARQIPICLPILKCLAFQF